MPSRSRTVPYFVRLDHCASPLAPMEGAESLVNCACSLGLPVVVNINQRGDISAWPVERWPNHDYDDRLKTEADKVRAQMRALGFTK